MEEQKKRVLVVDDDPSFRELLSVFLAEQGYDVDTAVDGKQALRRLRRNGADVVLLDLDLPKMSGLDVMRKMQTDKIEAKIIAISGHDAAEQLAADGLRLGADQFITKPVDLGQLEICLSAVLRSSENAGVHVLVVDDDPTVRELLSGFLEEKEYRVSVAADGQEALETVRREHPDMMLLDLYLPKLSGLEVLEKLSEEGHDIGVIAISGEDDEAAARATFKLGAADFITKPLDLEYLEFSLVAKLMSLGR